MEQSESSKEKTSIWGEPILTREKALNEVETWLNVKRIRPSVREEQKEALKEWLNALSWVFFQWMKKQTLLPTNCNLNLQLVS